MNAMNTHTRLMFGSPSTDKDILWATKFLAPDPFIALVHEGRRIAVMSPLEYNRAKKESNIDEVLLKDELYTAGEPLMPMREDALRFLRRFGVTEVAVSPHFPAVVYQHLIEHGIAVHFTEPLFPERAIKTEDEVAEITRVQRFMEGAFAEILAILAQAEIKDGYIWHNGVRLTSEKLKFAFERALLEYDCTCEATIIASGDQATDPHCAGSGPLLANVPIVCDLFPRSRKTGYWSDMSRTVCKGTLTPRAREIYNAVEEAQQLGLSMVRPGQYGHEIHAAIIAYFDKRGFATKRVNDVWEGFFHGTGHGVGLDIHEPPFISKRPEQLLIPGNVITIEPGLYYPGIGGVRIEDTVLVTENGYRNLATHPKGLLEIE